METGVRNIGFYPAQANSYVVTLDANQRTNEYPLKCWVLVEEQDPDPEMQLPVQNMIGCFSVEGDIIDRAGNLNLVARIGDEGFLKGEKFLEYKFIEAGLD